jgi:hypothetical protein
VSAVIAIADTSRLEALRSMRILFDTGGDYGARRPPCQEQNGTVPRQVAAGGLLGR